MSSITPYRVYQRLFSRYGSQNWWPADTAFEVMIGAILTQNTSWTNVEKALVNLRQANLLDCEKLANVKQPALAKLLKPVGYFNVKATRLQNFCRWYLASDGNGQLRKHQTHELRRMLLSVNGVGPETADDILLYAFEREVFVIDAYTRRLFARLGLIDGDEHYEQLRNWFETKLARQKHKQQLFNEFHALIVHHAKYYCLARNPACTQCCLSRMCCSRMESG